jgi:hypothetical protein
MEHIGIDVHKMESQLCILSESGEIIERRIRTQSDRFAAVLGERARARILIEASTESEDVLDVRDPAHERRRTGSALDEKRVASDPRHASQCFAIRGADELPSFDVDRHVSSDFSQGEWIDIERTSGLLANAAFEPALRAQRAAVRICNIFGCSAGEAAAISPPARRCGEPSKRLTTAPASSTRSCPAATSHGPSPVS